jgi:thiol peroxidase
VGLAELDPLYKAPFAATNSFSHTYPANSDKRGVIMGRTGVITFKGTPLTLAGNEVKPGQAAPDFTLNYFEGGMKELKLADLKGKPTILSVVPSLDTAVCAMQTKKFNDQLAALGDKINAVTVSMDLPFAMNRFCGAESIKNMRVGSDYQDRDFGTNYGTLIEELKIECRAVFVLDASGRVKHAEYVSEVTNEPDYDAALEALRAEL